VKHKTAGKLLDRYRVTDGEGFRLADYDPADQAKGLIEHTEIDALMADGVERLAQLQLRLYAAESFSLLLVLQAMDAAGKDGTIKHVMTGVNPQGVDVVSFKQPGPIDLLHGFLWRIHAHAPMRGRIGIFNRSHYEDVLVCRVHPEILDTLKLPDSCRGKKFWKHRLQDIVNFEEYLAHQGTKVIKVFLHLSKDEQKRRFLSRIDEPHKNWKFSAADLKERDFWDAYQEAYEHAIKATATPEAPWFVVPADNKPFAHLVVAEAVIEALEAMDLQEPSPPPAECALLKEARAKLVGE
jgi:PPK2 family polyphosphate:nucleotide phosphotransferase